MSIEKPFWHPSIASAFLFDWDGVVAETKLDFTAVRERYYGGRRAMLLEEASTLAPSDKEALMKDLCALEMEGAEKSVAVPGALELIERLKSQNIPIAIVSRNCAESIELAAKNIGLQLPENVWNRDNSQWIKPDPRSLLHAASVLGVQPHDCVFIGDFIYDIQCARRAGMRSVLVQRDEPEWNVWTDVSYSKLTDLIEGLDDPKPIVPWEYREIHNKRGDKWINGAHRLSLLVPESTSPTLDCWLARAAALCVSEIQIAPDIIFSPTDWKLNQSFEQSAMGRPLLEVAKEFLAPRYPMVKVTAENENGLKAPKNSLDLTRFIERKIF